MKIKKLLTITKSIFIPRLFYGCEIRGIANPFLKNKIQNVSMHKQDNTYDSQRRLVHLQPPN